MGGAPAVLQVKVYIHVNRYYTVFVALLWYHSMDEMYFAIKLNFGFLHIVLGCVFWVAM
jgi:hypothetical protein